MVNRIKSKITIEDLEAALTSLRASTTENKGVLVENIVEDIKRTNLTGNMLMNPTSAFP